MKIYCQKILLSIGLFIFTTQIFASSGKNNNSTILVDNPANEITQANNPLANLKAFNLQNYFYPTISGFNTTGDTAWLRYAQPIDKFLIRASLPIQTFPVSQNGARQTGTGDFNIFAVYTFDTGNSNVSAGIGPLLVAPTASPTLLGAGKWQGGLAGVYYNASSKVFQYGGLVTYQADFAGQQNRQHTSILTAQPFAFYQLGKGLYLRSAPIWTFNFYNNTGVIPLSLGVGKIVKVNKTVYNFFIEPQFAVYHHGLGQPTSQIYAGLNMQFYG